jgi:hypothetical protein
MEHEQVNNLNIIYGNVNKEELEEISIDTNPTTYTEPINNYECLVMFVTKKNKIYGLYGTSREVLNSRKFNCYRSGFYTHKSKCYCSRMNCDIFKDSCKNYDSIKLFVKYFNLEPSNQLHVGIECVVINLFKNKSQYSSKAKPYTTNSSNDTDNNIVKRMDNIKFDLLRTIKKNTSDIKNLDNRVEKLSNYLALQIPQESYNPKYQHYYPNNDQQQNVPSYYTAIH